MKTMLSGMGTTFGAPPVGYTYSYEIWSDASVPMYVEQQDIASFMGAYFPSAKGFYGKKTLPSIFDTGTAVSKAACHDQKYYFNMYVSDSSNPHTNPIYKQVLTQLPLVKHDPKIYYYHVYTAGGFKKGNSIHKPKIEAMGFRDPDQQKSTDVAKKGNVTFVSQLSGLSFYNSSGTDVQVSLTYGPAPYTFTIEKYSYSSLSIPTLQEKKDTTSPSAVASSTKKKSSVAKADDVKIQAVDEDVTKPDDAAAFSLRPNTLTFSKYNDATKKYETFRSFSLASQGFGGAAYTIEIFQDPGKPLEVGIQGFNPGNYDTPITSRVRDVTPCPCTFWYQSFAQAGSVEGYSDLAGQIWVVYAGADSPIQLKVTPGQSVAWDLVRPLIDQGDQFVYFVYVLTTDDAIAQKFVAKIATQVLGKNVVAEYEKIMNTPIPSNPVNEGLDITGDVGGPVVQSITADQQVATLMGSLSISDGVIEDAEQGVVGYIVGTDVFTPKGLGFGRFYYVLSPSVISVGTIVSSLYGCLDSAKTSELGGSDIDIQKSLTTLVNEWLVAYIKNPDDAQQQVETYLLKYGSAKIVNDKTKKLTKFGQARLASLVSGPVSIKYPAMKLSTVLNQYVYDFGKSAPDKMPKASVQAQMDKMETLSNQKKQAAKVSQKRYAHQVRGNTKLS